MRIVRDLEDVFACVEIKLWRVRLAASTSTPSTRHMLDGVAMSVPTQVLAEALDRTVRRELLLDCRLVRALRHDEDGRIVAPRELGRGHLVQAVLLADLCGN